MQNKRKIISRSLTILFLLFFDSANSQRVFDSLQLENVLTTLPTQINEKPVSDDIINAIETIDRKYRQISDTLFNYTSLKHTIFQTVFIETNDSLLINPLLWGARIRTTNIIFNNISLNKKIDTIAQQLDPDERIKLFNYLYKHFDNFSMEDKKLYPQSVRIKYIKFADDNKIHAGLDIYGSHFLWTIDRNKNWDVVSVEKLWVY